MARLDTEYANLRAAMEWSLRDDDNLGQAALMAGILADYWTLRGYLREGYTWLMELSIRTAQVAPDRRVLVLDALGRLLYSQGDFARAAGVLDECIAVYRGLGDRRRLASALWSRGAIARWQADLAGARAFLEEALALHRDLGDPAVAAAVLGSLARAQEDAARAGALLAEGLDLIEMLDGGLGKARALGAMGIAYRERGEYARARVLFEECLVLWRGLGYHDGIASVLRHLGRLAREQGDHALAARRYREALLVRREQGDSSGILTALEGLALAWLARDQWARATRLLGATERWRETTGTAILPSERAAHAQGFTAAREACGEPTFEREFAAGQVMTLEEAIAYALEAAAGE
jgi:tetratricopeptide (TPR) repeat protein